MRVYHGSYIEIAKPDIIHSRNKVDFGVGFYVTENVLLYSMSPIPKNGWILFLNAGEDRINLSMRL